MTAWLLGLVLAGQAAAPAPTVAAPAEETAPALVSRMIARYAAAKTLRGRIVMSQRLGDRSLQTTTEIQAEAPSRLFIRQSQAGVLNNVALITGDGQQFSYPVPVDLAGRPGERLIESVDQGGVMLDYRRIYAVVGRSLLDRSTALDLVIARLEDLRFVRNQWATLAEVSPSPVPGTRTVGGQWREYGEAAVSGSFTMSIDAGAQLRRFTLTETIAIPGTGRAEPITTVWDVDVAVDAPVDAGMFRLVR